MSENSLERRMRFSALLVLLGLLVEAVSLTWRHPTAFLVFMLIGGAFMGLGMLVFLYSIASLPTVRAPKGE